LFQLSSFKCPSVKVEKTENMTDEMLSIFYEHIHVLKEGLLMFDQLFAKFLTVRLDSDWDQVCQDMTKWLSN